MVIYKEEIKFLYYSLLLLTSLLLLFLLLENSKNNKINSNERVEVGVVCGVVSLLL
jgi:hypothetical protein